MNTDKPMSEIEERTLFMVGQVASEAAQVIYTPEMRLLLARSKDMVLDHDPESPKRIRKAALSVFDCIDDLSAAELLIVLDSFITFVYQYLPDGLKQTLFGVSSPAKVDDNIVRLAAKEIRERFGDEDEEDE